MAGEPQEQADTIERVNMGTVLRHRGFRNLWLGQVVSQVGDYFAFLALMVVVSGFSSSAATTTQDVAGLMIAITVPRLVFGVIAGVFVDRWDRRWTMIGADVVRAVLAVALIPAFLTHALWLVYVLAFCLSTCGTLFNPAKGAVIPQLVPPAHLTAANSLSATTQMLATLIGPALAGGAFALAGRGNEWIAFVIDAVSFGISAAAVATLRLPPREARVIAEPGAHPLQDIGRELVVGLRALVLSRAMITLSAAMAITMLGIGALNVLWVVFLKTNFGFQSSELAWRLSIIDVVFSGGMVLAAVLVGNFLAQVAPKWLVVGGLVGGGLFTLPLGFLPDYWLVVPCMALVGLFVGPISPGVSTLMQIVVPNEQLGRVGGAFGTVVDTATLISMSAAGVLGGLLGIPVVFFLSGVLCAAGGVLAWAWLPPVTMATHGPASVAAAPADRALAV
ncbi:MAG TPA: MFS transporter [Chloroflexia bacterium]|nr:MFS transporter [Chloroflexia bacterium]